MRSTTVTILIATLAIVGCQTDVPEDSGDSAVAVEPDTAESADTANEDAVTTHDSEDDRRDTTSRRDAVGGATGSHPSLVLYDGDGQAVDAVVSNVASRPYGEFSAGLEFDPLGQRRSCVYVNAVGQAVFSGAIPFDLETGEVGPCAASSVTLFRDAACEQPIYYPQALVLRYEGAVMWPSGTAFEATSYFQEVGGSCTEVQNSQGRVFVPLAPIPDSIANALPNPPYEVRSHY